LSLVADSRAQAISDWVTRQRRTVTGLAETVSLRLYVAQLIDAANRGQNAAAQPEAEFLKNLLEVTASRTGFSARPVGPDVNANVRRQGVAGLIILDKKRTPLVATSGAPALDGTVGAFVRGAEPAPVALMDLTTGPGGTLQIGLMTPVYPPQTAAERGRETGYILAVRPVAEALFPLLREPGATSKTDEVYLVRKEGAQIRYLSPLRDGTRPMARTMAANAPQLAGARAAAEPGAFFDGRDYAGRDVLSVSRKIAGTDWVLVYSVGRDEALGPSEERLTRLMIIASLALLLAFAGALALWRHGASRRASTAAGHYKEAAERLESQRNFLRLLTDSQPTAISIVDEKDTVRFVNATAANSIGVVQDDAAGKSLAALLGPDRARRYERLNREALETGRMVEDLVRIHGPDGAEQVLQIRHVPLEPSATVPRGVLLVEEDVTAAIVERERRVQSLRQLVDTLLMMVDCRDPNAADHSKRVAILGRAVAHEMGLPELEQETAAFAGDLMNIGKLLVPETILTKPGPLTDEELTLVREGLESGPMLLEGISFDGPVVETLRQAHERWDGTGRPKKLKGAEILVTARIIAVANAFVAMASPRAHRPELDIDEVIAALRADSDKAYDRRVVSALVNYMDNRGGREEVARWQP